MPQPALVGYFHNWNIADAPYIEIDKVDSRYNVIVVAFAMPVSTVDMTMTFTPDGVTKAAFINQIQKVKNAGKKVLISVGGATASIDLTSQANKKAFVSSLSDIITEYGFDGLDIDIESGNSVYILGGATITDPSGNPAMVNLIDAIKEIMASYYASNGKKLLLTMAPETAFVQGGQSGFGNVWGGYLPIIHALKDSLDLLHVQLYNSGTMYGLDKNIYAQGTADFIVAMTEAAIKGFSTSGGNYTGIPANKVAVALPACNKAAGGGYTQPDTIEAAINYLLGKSAKPGNYTLMQNGGYPNLKGLMTWSINWDAAKNCDGAYSYATVFEKVFDPKTSGVTTLSANNFLVYPNPASTKLHIKTSQSGSEKLSIYTSTGTKVYSEDISGETQIDISQWPKGVYLIQLSSQFMKLMVH